MVTNLLVTHRQEQSKHPAHHDNWLEIELVLCVQALFVMAVVAVRAAVQVHVVLVLLLAVAPRADR